MTRGDLPRERWRYLKAGEPSAPNAAISEASPHEFSLVQPPCALHLTKPFSRMSAFRPLPTLQEQGSLEPWTSTLGMRG
jgi:hypothetical protein